MQYKIFYQIKGDLLIEADTLAEAHDFAKARLQDKVGDKLKELESGFLIRILHKFYTPNQSASGG